MSHDRSGNSTVHDLRSRWRRTVLLLAALLTAAALAGAPPTTQG